MFGRKAREARSKFNAGLLKTFGKLSQLDIDKVDGRRERLIAKARRAIRLGRRQRKAKSTFFDLKLSVGPTTRVKALSA